MDSFPRWLAVFLGKVTRLLADEEDNVSKLFGGGQKGAIILCDLAIEALAPLAGSNHSPNDNFSSLCSRINALRSPEAAYDSFCVTDEFVRRVLSQSSQMEGALTDEKLADLLSAAYKVVLYFLSPINLELASTVSVVERPLLNWSKMDMLTLSRSG